MNRIFCLTIIFSYSCKSKNEPIATPEERVIQVYPESIDNPSTYLRTNKILNLEVAYQTNAKPYGIFKIVNYMNENAWSFLTKNLEHIYHEVRNNDFAIINVRSEDHQMKLIPERTSTNSYNIDTVLAYGEKYKSTVTTAESGRIILIFLDGFYCEQKTDSTGKAVCERNSKVLAVTLQGAGIIGIFKRAVILTGANGKTETERQQTREYAEALTMVHEMGHILGLVDAGVGLATSHEDHQNDGHCNNQRCIMYFAIDASNSSTGWQNQINTTWTPNDPSIFDNNCLMDFEKF